MGFIAVPRNYSVGTRYTQLKYKFNAFAIVFLRETQKSYHIIFYETSSGGKIPNS